MQNKTRWITTTATLLALTLVWQSLRMLIGVTPVSTYIIGTLVNATLIIAVMTAGLWAGVIIALIAPFVAMMQGFAAAPMVPYVAAGNLALVLAYYYLSKIHFTVGIVVGAAIKTAVIVFGNALMIAGKSGNPVMTAMWPAMLNQMQQPITAVLGGIIAWPTARAVMRVLKKEQP